MNSIVKTVSIVSALTFLMGCADNQIRHCLYGASTDVQKIQAKLCDDTNVPYYLNGSVWESAEIISNPCEDMTIQFIYKDGRVGEYIGLYASGSGQTFTSFDQFYTATPETIHLVKTARDYRLTECRVPNDINFKYDYTSGELCNNRYYECGVN